VARNRSQSSSHVALAWRACRGALGGEVVSVQGHSLLRLTGYVLSARGLVGHSALRIGSNQACLPLSNEFADLIRWQPSQTVLADEDNGRGRRRYIRGFAFCSDG